MLHEAMIKLIKKIENISSNQSVGKPLFHLDYEIYKIDSSNFIQIEPSFPNRKTAFIDGGNIEILGSPGFSIQVNRIFLNIFQGKKRILPLNLPQKIEYLSATLATSKKNAIFYDTFIIPFNEKHQKFLPEDKDLSFDSFDQNLTQGGFRAHISHMSNVARRFSEWNIARLMCEKELEEGDIITLDGPLRTAYPNERKYAEKSLNAAYSNKIFFTGLAKASHLYTDTGLPLIQAVMEVSKQIEYPLWFIPIAEGRGIAHEAKIYVTKLHPQAQIPFRFELYNKQLKNLSSTEEIEIFSNLVNNSKDISFPGYPYGLIDADHQSRVRFKEIEYYQRMLLTLISQNPKLDKIVNQAIITSQAHDILNQIIK